MGKCGARTGLIVLALMCGSAVHAAACRPDQVMVRGPEGTVAQFRVDLADDAAERGQGLMFRESMASAAGMLFAYEAPQRAVFWMKNTLIPLDMIFADPTGRVTHVHAEAVPLDTSPIDGGEGVQFVLEINGGLAAQLGIVPGHVLRHPSIDPVMAAWPCGE